MRRRRNSDKKLVMPEISLTPLIDTALTLLVIFMVSTPMMQNAINVDLPKTSARESSQAKREDLVVYIDSKEKFYLGDKQLSEKELVDILGKKTNKEDPQTIYVKADRSVKHGTVCEFVDRLQYYPGVKNVALATQTAT